tara:strand:+ start:341 stop:505 length:165 start_codon:yes stop_codon:yes gene_type:complete
MREQQVQINLKVFNPKRSMEEVATLLLTVVEAEMAEMDYLLFVMLGNFYLLLLY